jgi:hypothetical protein
VHATTKCSRVACLASARHAHGASHAISLSSDGHKQNSDNISPSTWTLLDSLHLLFSQNFETNRVDAIDLDAVLLLSRKWNGHAGSWVADFHCGLEHNPNGSLDKEI